MITLIPTRNRPDLLTKFCKSAVDTNTTTSGLIIIDESDWQSNHKIYDQIIKPDGYRFYISKAIRMADKIREVWNETNIYKSVCILNDDHYILTKEWDTKVQYKITGYNFVSTNDNWRSPQKASGATVWSKPLLDALGWPIFPPGMIHLFIDDLWEKIGKSTGCWHIDHSITIEHHHPFIGKSPIDATFQETYGTDLNQMNQSEVWRNDCSIYTELCKPNQLIPIVDKIRSLMGLCEIQRSA